MTGGDGGVMQSDGSGWARSWLTVSEPTSIQCCDSTANPVMGCPGCELWCATRKTCYAGVLHGQRGGHNRGFAPVFTRPTLFPRRMAEAARWDDLTGKERPEKPWLNGLARLIFVSDMGDALAEKGVQDKNGNRVRGGVPFDFLRTEIIDAVLSPSGRRHRWLWLSKRPARLAEFCEWLRSRHGLSIPPNLCLGTSVTSKATLHRAKQTADVGDEHIRRFLSAEPLWEDISLA